MSPEPTPDMAVAVLCTVQSKEAAEHLIRPLLEERLAACINHIGGVESSYRWQGTIETAQESLLIIKTHVSKAKALTQRIQELHTYEVPEILVLACGVGFG